jgi:hypothetical protein
MQKNSQEKVKILKAKRINNPLINSNEMDNLIFVVRLN